jgi:predicted Zn finger-like uncharacterized protein
MIVNCPSCSARFRLDRQKLAGKRVTLRCPRCRQTFRTEIPAPPGVSAPSGPGRLRVMVAHGETGLRSTIGEILARDGIDAVCCADGMEALARIDAEPLPVLIVDVALPGLLAFELVERLRQHPRLDQLKIILVPSIFRKTAYKRTPSSLYGADAYVEQHHLADDLVPTIHRLLTGLHTVAERTVAGAEEQLPAVTVPMVAERDFVDLTNSRIQKEEEQNVLRPDEETITRGRRLARIIVSDIALYHEARVNEGVRSGTFMELFAAEIREGQDLLAKRIGADVCARENFLENAFAAFIERRQKELKMEAAG